jgi:hypothetical protein
VIEGRRRRCWRAQERDQHEHRADGGAEGEARDDHRMTSTTACAQLDEAVGRRREIGEQRLRQRQLRHV